MIAVNENEAGPTDDTAAELRSPFFKTTEHPVECFSFWFYFGVSYQLSTLSRLYYKYCLYYKFCSKKLQKTLLRVPYLTKFWIMKN